MNAVEACFHYTGIVGIKPHGMTLRQLWMMGEGRIKQRRREILELANLAWSIDSVNAESYLLYGEFSREEQGGKVEISDEMQSRVDAEVERIRAENPKLPKVRVSK